MSEVGPVRMSEALSEDVDNDDVGIIHEQGH